MIDYTDTIVEIAFVREDDYDTKLRNAPQYRTGFWDHYVGSRFTNTSPYITDALPFQTREEAEGEGYTARRIVLQAVVTHTWELDEENTDEVVETTS